MKIFLTGATGFVGSHLLEKLLSEGHQVFALVRSPSKVKISSVQLKLIKGELNSPFSLSENDLNTMDVVIHTAGIVHSFTSQEFFEVNKQGTINLINKFQSNTKLKFILISSLAARGPFETEIIDQPVSDYGKSKKAAELSLAQLAPTSWTKIIIRPPMVIGPRDTAVLDIFKMVQEGFVLLPGLDSKNKLYSFVCVHDLVNTITQSINLSEHATIYSAFDQNITFYELIKMIQYKLKKSWIIFLPIPAFLIKMLASILAFIHQFFPHNLRLTPDKINELLPKKWICDNQQSKLLLKQQYEFDLDRTIEITLKDYQKNNWIKKT